MRVRKRFLLSLSCNRIRTRAVLLCLTLCLTVMPAMAQENDGFTSPLAFPRADSGARIYLPLIASPDAARTPGSVVAVLEADGRFTLFADLLEQAALDDLLSAAEPLTLFAPTDEAFARLARTDSRALDALRSDPYNALTRTLLYHAAPYTLDRTISRNRPTVPTLEGASVRLDYNELGALRVNGIPVAGSPLHAGEVLIYPLDGILAPR
ncbi:MAG: fasciclin domain-containing protein [Caldilineaceae bacterium]|nr:fasciclin domain-containing protein [Caldilineaceae bacterium]